MAGAVALEARDLAAHPDIGEILLDRALERARQLADGIFGRLGAPSGAARSGDRSSARLCIAEAATEEEARCGFWSSVRAGASMRSPGRLPPRRWSTSLSARPAIAGIAEEAECVAIAATDIAGLVAFCRRERIDFVVVGPEAPLVLGAGRRARSRGHPAFGPTAAAAALEGSKGFTKDLCARHASRPPPIAASRPARGQSLYRRARRADRRQGRRARRRQGRDRRR